MGLLKSYYGVLLSIMDLTNDGILKIRILTEKRKISEFSRFLVILFIVEDFIKTYRDKSQS